MESVSLFMSIWESRCHSQRKRERKLQTNKNRNERGAITTDTTNTKNCKSPLLTIKCQHTRPCRRNQQIPRNITKTESGGNRKSKQTDPLLVKSLNLPKIKSPGPEGLADEFY